MLQVFDKYYHDYTWPHVNLEPDPLSIDVMMKLGDRGAYHALTYSFSIPIYIAQRWREILDLLVKETKITWTT